jgi:hypothetical protein
MEALSSHTHFGLQIPWLHQDCARPAIASDFSKITRAGFRRTTIHLQVYTHRGCTTVWGRPASANACRELRSDRRRLIGVALHCWIQTFLVTIHKEIAFKN